MHLAKLMLKKIKKILTNKSRFISIFSWVVFLLISFLVAYSSHYYLRSLSASQSSTTFFQQYKKSPKSINSTHKDFGLAIEKNGIDLPVVPDVDGSDKVAYIAALMNGIAHYKGTSRPDQTGNVFIFGHSSDYRWRKNPYESAFAKLPELTQGDSVSLWYKEKEYHYEVTETKIIEPTDVGWLNQTSDNYLTLMTCYPIGSAKQRFVVRAKRI